MSNFRVPYLVGNGYKRDHQYWPVRNMSLTDDGQSLLVDLAMLMQLAWRVREWTVSGASFSCSHTHGGITDNYSGTVEGFKMQMRRAVEDDEPRLVTDERDILGPMTDAEVSSEFFESYKNLRNQGVVGNADGHPGSGVLTDLPGGAGATVFIGTGIEVLYDPTRKLFDPSFYFSASWSTFGVPPSFQLTATTEDELAANPSWGRSELHLIDPDGGEFSIPLAMISSVGSGSGSDVTVTPTKWWKFKNRLGQDVYDENNGHIINDPFA